jgi:hypothetical protein
LKVTCVVPSARGLVEISAAFTPAAVGAPAVSNGGHFSAHPPVQVEVGLVSPSKRYSARPWASVRMGPREFCAVATPAGPDGAAAALLAGAVVLP